MNKYKEKIVEYEYYKNGVNKLACTDVKVVNVRKRKDKVIADVILASDFEAYHIRYNNCEYPLSLFK